MGTVSVFVPIPKVTKLELIFKDVVYMAGETVNGKVILELNDPLFLYSVKLKISGKGFVEWIGESNESLDYNRKIYCSNKEDYIHHTVTLWGADYDAEGLEQVLEAGTHDFQFSYKLNDSLPSSFRGKHGKIRYYVRALCTATGGTIAQVEKDLKVQETFNLNIDPANKLPLMFAAEKDISYWCWKFPGIAMTVTVDKRGFVPGDDIIITSEISNQTPKYLRLISYTIAAEIKYKAFVQEAFCDHYRELIEKSNLKTMQAAIEAPPRQVTKILGSLQLPKPMFVTDMSRCKIISVSYQLEVAIPIPTHRIMVTARAPIKIGTIPVHFTL
ncbi:arrestin domain-containing protein 5-like [Pristis pectinata]|uniref:arrestin domain-containing protein 5-like n=1 Tax=Pristis pectinata TaxID=685728 RepID=UPI00223DC4E9|nr:arrestin domain-containing protein 5-like [Pristis pectinata]